MKRLRKLLGLSFFDFCTLCEASLILLLSALSLRIWSAETILGVLQRQSLRLQESSQRPPKPESIERLSRLVEIADRNSVLSSSCLRRSITLAWLLGRQGIGSTVRIGVAKDQDSLRAHAWLEIPGQRRLVFFMEPEYTALS